VISYIVLCSMCKWLVNASNARPHSNAKLFQVRDLIPLNYLRL
jgi:hypothetical protein